MSVLVREYYILAEIIVALKYSFIVDHDHSKSDLRRITDLNKTLECTNDDVLRRCCHSSGLNIAPYNGRRRTAPFLFANLIALKHGK